jgi:hypothetical protein
MNNVPNLNEEELRSKLEAIADRVLATAEQYVGKPNELLALLRTLESLHRKVREEVFELSLPDNRKALYQFLRDIEEKGGWPYIERMKIQQICRNYSKTGAAIDTQESNFLPDSHE